MTDFLPTLLVTLGGAVLVSACAAGFSKRERRWVGASFLMHVAFACSQVPITVAFYGRSDMFLYFSYGEILARMMERDPLHVIPEVTALLLQNQHHLPLTIIGTGTATGSMSAFAAWAFYLLGPSKYAACVAFAMVSLCGKVAMYRVFRDNVVPENRLYVAIAAFFVPSFVFWSSGLIKEAVAVAGFGWCILGLHLWIQRNRPVAGWALIVLGAIPIALIKAYILFPLVLAGGSWYYWARGLKRGRRSIRPAYFALAGVLGLGGVVLLGQYFPEYAVDSFSSRAAELQEIGRGRGGSTYALGSDIPTSFLGQFVYAPAALLTSLFRPSLFEVRNLLMLANAIETTILTVLFARILFTRNLGNVRRQISEEPFLVFCLVFVIAFGVAVGLASSNLGTLSRYRCPLVPFFVVLLLVLGKPVRARTPAREVRRGPETVLGAA